MFTEEELEDCPNERFEEWLHYKESNIRLIAENVDFKYAETSRKLVRDIIVLLMEAYDQKKCPYA